jgi:hypothetical protein
VLPIQPTVTQATRPGSEASVGSSKQRLACHHHIQRINSPFLKEAGGTATRRPSAEQPHEPNEIGLASSRMSYKIINGVREALKPLGLSPQCGEMPAHLDPGPNVRPWFVSPREKSCQLVGRSCSHDSKKVCLVDPFPPLVQREAVFLGSSRLPTRETF